MIVTEKRTLYSAANLLQELKFDAARWNRMPAEEDIASSVKAIENRGIRVLRAQDGPAALARIKGLIPAGSEVMNGSSTTLIEIGYTDLLKSEQHNWIDLYKMVTSENDAVKGNELRRKSVTSEYFLSGVNAIATTGELVSCDASGSRVGAWPFAARHLVLVAGINKIVPSRQMLCREFGSTPIHLRTLAPKKSTALPARLGNASSCLARGSKDGSF